MDATLSTRRKRRAYHRYAEKGRQRPPRQSLALPVRSEVAVSFYPRIVFIPCLMILAVVAPARAEPRRTVPVDGDPFPAELVAVDGQWQFTFRSGTGDRTVVAGDLVSWGECPQVPGTPLLLLNDGSLIAADVLKTDEQTLVADSGIFGLLKLPIAEVAAVVFRSPLDQHARDQLLDQVGLADDRVDRLLLSNGDSLSGRCEGISADAIRMTTGVGSLQVEVHRVGALSFGPALPQRAVSKGLHVVTGFADGSRLMAERLVVDRHAVRVTTAGGLGWSTSSDPPVYLQVRGGPRVSYLSDLSAAGYGRVPYLELPWPYVTDRNLLGGRLRAGGRLYLKGLAVHSASRLTYLPQAGYRRFEAELAIDDVAGGRGSVRYRIFVDGTQKYASATVRGGQPPTRVSVDVTGAKRLDLVVDFADRADEQDHADWLDARLVR